ncbi:Oxaloacetate decarboxylase [compost metagenome]
MFFYGDIEDKNKDVKLLADAITLGKAYAQAGADCLFVPGLKNKKFLEKLASSVEIPINIMLDISQDNIEDYAQLGIARISYGPFIYLDYKNSSLELNRYFTGLIERFKQLEAKNIITLSIDGVE